jgi:hypothetical protein
MLPKFPTLCAPGDEDLLQNAVMIHFAEDGSARNISTHVHDTMKEEGFLAAYARWKMKWKHWLKVFLRRVWWMGRRSVRTGRLGCNYQNGGRVRSGTVAESPLLAL